MSFDFGAADEGRMWLTGFADREKEGRIDKPTYFRWATGKESKLKFVGVRPSRQAWISVEFEIEPYLQINRNKEMVIRSPLSSATIIVKPGWNKYRVALDFPGRYDMIVNATYKESASPRSLGYDLNDPRDLAVRWKRIRLSYARENVAVLPDRR